MKMVKYMFTVMALLWLFLTVLIMIPVSLILTLTLFLSKKHFVEWSLFLFAFIAALGLYPLGFIYEAFNTKSFPNYLRKLSLGIDIGGNTTLGTLLNHNFITERSQHPFGAKRETISDNLGENERDETLSVLGKRFTNLLGVIDFDHAQKSIVED